MAKTIKYNLALPDSDVLISVKLDWSESNERIAKHEAYKGEYTIEDDGQPEPDLTTTDDVLNALLGVTE